MNNNIGEKYLPVGTVVMLKGGSKRVMITGFCSMPADNQSEMFDYTGCMYPEGVISSDQTALFNHDQIQNVYHLGLVDDEETKFKTSLKALISQMQVSNNNVASVPVTLDTPTVSPVPPVGPGLPGYVAPQPASAPAAPVTSNGFQFDANGNVIAAPQTPVQQTTTQPLPNIKFDANGVVISE